jgi:hypothetical protein
MSTIAEQVHGKFKVFTGALADDGSLGGLAGEVEAWVRSSKVAPKSIGVEYVESLGKLVLSIGYRDDEAAYGVKLQTVHIGKVDSLDAASLARLEQAMASASARLADIVCHELYVTAENDLLMVFMTHQAG